MSAKGLRIVHNSQVSVAIEARISDEEVRAILAKGEKRHFSVSRQREVLMMVNRRS